MVTALRVKRPHEREDGLGGAEHCAGGGGQDDANAGGDGVHAVDVDVNDAGGGLVLGGGAD